MQHAKGCERLTVVSLIFLKSRRRLVSGRSLASAGNAPVLISQDIKEVSKELNIHTKQDLHCLKKPINKQTNKTLFLPQTE